MFIETSRFAWIGRNGMAVATLSLAGALMALPAMAQQDAGQQSSGDAVADAARKARDEKKKEAPKTKRVYTDDDVSHSTAVSGGGTTGTASAPAGDAKAKDAKGKDDKAAEPEESPETKWRKQFKTAYGNLDRAQKELDILEREDSKAQVQYYTDPQKALAEQYTRKDINEKETKIAAKRKEIEQLKQQINDMEDALRKSGGDPGWAQP